MKTIVFDWKSIGNNIHQLRISNAYSISELSKIINVSSRSIKSWEKGLSAPSLKNIINLSNLFLIKIDDLLCYSLEVK